MQRMLNYSSLQTVGLHLEISAINRQKEGYWVETFEFLCGLAAFFPRCLIKLQNYMIFPGLEILLNFFPGFPEAVGARSPELKLPFLRLFTMFVHLVDYHFYMLYITRDY